MTQTKPLHPLKVWEDGNTPNREIVEYAHWIHKTNHYLFTNGEPIVESQITSPHGSDTTIAYEELVVDAETTMEAIRKYSWVVNTFLSPIVSPAAYALLERECPEDYQTFPCEIRATDGVIREYKLLNIVKLVDCMNKEKSTPFYSAVEKDQILGYENIHLYEDCTECMGGAKLARLKDAETVVLMAPSLMKILKKEKLSKGLRFTEMRY